jgi:hypothetical protein
LLVAVSGVCSTVVGSAFVGFSVGGRRGGVPLSVGRDGSGGVEPELYERDSARHQDQGQRKQEGTRDA